MVSNVDILINGDWSTKVFVFPSCLWYYLLKVLGYTLVTGLLILLGISHPGINHFLSELIEVLRDGKLSPEEKLHLIEVFKDEFLGGWADLTQLVVQEQKAKKEPPEKLP